MINLGEINWGKVIEGGFGILKSKISDSSTPPLTPTTQSWGIPVDAKLPPWVLPAAIIAGVFFLFGKQIKRLLK